MSSTAWILRSDTTAAGHGCIVGEGCHVHSTNERGAAPNMAIRKQFFCLSRHERSLSVKTQFSVTTVQYSTTAEEINYGAKYIQAPHFWSGTIAVWMTLAELNQPCSNRTCCWARGTGTSLTVPSTVLCTSSGGVHLMAYVAGSSWARRAMTIRRPAMNKQSIRRPF